MPGLGQGSCLIIVEFKMKSLNSRRKDNLLLRKYQPGFAYNANKFRCGRPCRLEETRATENAAHSDILQPDGYTQDSWIATVQETRNELAAKAFPGRSYLHKEKTYFISMTVKAGADSSEILFFPDLEK